WRWLACRCGLLCQDSVGCRRRCSSSNAKKAVNRRATPTTDPPRRHPATAPPAPRPAVPGALLSHTSTVAWSDVRSPAQHANMPSPEPSGDASPPRSSSPDSTSPHVTLPHVLSHDGWHTGGVAGDPRRSADDELGHGAPHQQLQQHRNIPAPAPAAASTVLLPRPLLSPAAARSQPADYIVFDSTPAARARARLRLCSTLLDDHLALRHQLDGVSAKRLALRCVLC